MPHRNSSEIKSIIPMIKDSMRIFKDRPALYYSDKSYTYDELNRISLKLASFLIQQGVKKPDVISVLVPRCEYMTIAALAVLRAGCAYQPLDASHPAERIRFMIEDADAPVIIVSKELAHLIEPLSEDSRKRVILYMEDISDLPEPENDIWVEADGNDRFVILYTSGTTGVPKGIILTHGNIFSACKWHLDFYEVNEECRMGQHPSFVFDLAIVELLFPLTAGASIYIIPEEIRTDLNELNAFLEKNRITHLTMTTQLGRQFAMTVSNNSLMHLTVGGEALISVVPPKGYKLHNDYGPAECTLYTTVFTVDEEYPEKVPIGRPVDEVRLYVVREDGREAGDNETGELCIAGPHVALGYLNRPELTDAAFTPNPFSDDPGYETMYHSGDLVIRKSDGIFEYLGRADRQVKIRGIRIEPAEIEALLRTYDGIDDVIIATPEIAGQRVIAAYYIADHELDKKALEEYVLKYKPSYMCPSFFMRITKVPLTTNGKVDYARLPEPDFNLNKEAYEEPVTDTQKILAAIYEEILKTDRVGLNDNFMRIGGNSLLVVRLLDQIEQRLSCRLSTRKIMECPVLKDLAGLIENMAEKGTDGGYRPLLKKSLPEQDFYHVSSAQERIYTAQKLLMDGDPTYLLRLTIRTKGQLDTGKTEDALCKMFVRHESLRTSFHLKGTKVVQKIHPADKEWIKMAIKRSYTASAPSVFRLEEAPLFWWSMGEDELTFYWHHIINDGTGTALFAREFAILYNGGELEALTIHQKEYADWEYRWKASDDHRQCLSGWMERMAHHTEARELRLTYAGISGVSDRKKAGHIRLNLDRKRSDEIRERCRSLGVTPYMFFISVFSVLLHKYSGMDRFLLGTAVDGRQSGNTAGLLGMFANTLPVPVKVSEDDDFAGLLESIKDMVLFMLDNRQAALEDIASEYEGLGGVKRTAHGHLLFDVLFVMRDFENTIPDMDAHAPSLYWPYDEMPMYDLTLEAGDEDGAYFFVFEYDRDLFREENMRYMSRHYDALLEVSLKTDTDKISDLSMTDEEEADLLLSYAAGCDQSFGNDTVTDRLKERSSLHPERTALIFGEESLTYGELWEQSGAIAGRLMKIFTDNSEPGDRKERWVALIAERGFGMIISIFGILRAGAGYVPISPEYPGERIRYMLKETEADCVLVCDDAIEDDILKGSGNKPVLRISGSDIREWSSEEDTGCRLPVVTPEQNAYMIFTSGSTGEPKGVVVEHRQLTAMLDAYRDIYKLEDDDTVLQYAEYVFDQSVWDIFHILTVGGRACLIPRDIVKDPERLMDYCEEKGVTVASLTPGFLRLLDPLRLDKLRLLDVGGEAPDRTLLTAWSRGRTVFNTYGPTETTVNASSYLFADNGRILGGDNDGKENVPIGRAVPGTRIYILNGNKPSGIGVPGELCIAGRQVTRGYYKRASLTDEKYVKDPFCGGRMYRSGDLARYLPDGNIEFISRMDDQVKLRGYRIETGEIEAVMRSLGPVKDAVVIIREDEGGEKRLCGYYIPEDDDFTKDGIRGIRDQLEKRLPIFMVPSVLMPVSKFKLTINGKIDRRSLPVPVSDQGSRRDRILPATKEERDCLDAFAEVLGLKDMGVTDDFLASGGDSIKAIRIVSLLRKKGYSLDAALLLKSRTVRALSMHLKESEKNEYREFEEVIPTPVMRMFKMADMKVPDHYCQSALYSIKGDTNITALKWALNGLVSCHGMLRMILKQDGGIRIRDIDETEELDLPVFECQDERDRIRIMDSLNASMELRNGRIMKAALFKASAGDRLFVSFHHYVIDEVSWEIITGDLNELYRVAVETVDPDAGYGRARDILPDRTVSFGEWSQALLKYRETPEFTEEGDYWNRVHSKIDSRREKNAALLNAFVKGEGETDTGSAIVTATTDKDISGKLIHIAGVRYRTRPDVLLAALFIKAVNLVCRTDSLMFQMESHGRGYAGEGLQNDRTVGWFTAVYPMLFKVTDDTDSQVIQVKEDMASVPNYGIGYGIMYEDLIQMGGFVFNYLGSLREDRGETIAYSGEYAGKESDDKNVEPRTISVNIRESDNGFSIECVYDRIFSEEKIRGLLDKYVEVLGEAAKELYKKGTVISPSDVCVSHIMAQSDWKKLTKAIAPDDIAAIAEPTPLQQGMLYRCLAEPGTGAYILQDRLLIRGEWRKDDFIAALKLASVRFDALRIRFALNGFDEPWQIIFKEGTVWPEYLETAGKSMDEMAADDLKRGFDPENDVMFRVTLNLDSTVCETKELLISSHHSIIDGWSFRILTDTVTDYYKRLCSGGSYEELYDSALKEASAGLSYSEYLRLGRKGSSEATLRHWDDYLSGINEGAGLGPVSENEGGGKAAFSELNINGEKERQIQKYARDNGITLSSFFGTLWGMLLGFENDVTDVVFGETVSGRNVSIDGIEDCVGMFINTIPVRIRWDVNTDVSDVFKSRQNDYIKMQPYETAPLYKIMSRKGSGTGLIKTLYVYENFPSGKEDENFRVIMQHEEVDYPISLSVEEQDGFSVLFQYDALRYEQSYIERLIDRYDNLIMQTVLSKDQKVSELERISLKEREFMLSDISGIDRPFPEESFAEMMYGHVSKTPDKCALIMDGCSLSYGQLWEASSRLAHKLGAGGERFVAVYANRSMELIVSLIASFIAGAAYVPLDTDYPDERIDFILSDCTPDAVFRHVNDGTNKRTGLFEKAGVRIIDVSVEELLKEKETAADGPAPFAGIKNSLAYMIYTSGTTGVPKGVEIEHAALSEFIYSNREFLGERSEVVLQTASYVFDASVFEIFIPLSTGGTVCLISREKLSSVEAMAGYCRDNGVKVFASTNALLQALDPEEFGMFRVISAGGDAANADIFARWAEHTELMINDYGPTEACVNALAYKYSKGHKGAIPIGRPYLNRKVYIMQGDKLCGIWQKGEVCIGGEGLARGYHNRPDLNSQAFVKNPYTGERIYRTGDIGYFGTDGEVFFLGRYDDQVKIRGFRIETGEIESCMRGYGLVKEAVVISRSDNGREAYLAAYITENEPVDTDMLKAYLMKKLPSYMVPAVITKLDKIPRTVSDKLDTESLPVPVFSDDKAAPEGYLEEMTAALYEKILGISKVGRNDSFFDLGGSSLDMMRLISELGRYHVTISDVASAPTPRLLGELMLDRWRGLERKGGGVIMLKDGVEDVPAIFCIPPSGGMSLCYLPLVKELDHEGRIYGLTDPKYTAFAAMPLEKLATYEVRDEGMWTDTIDHYHSCIGQLFKDGDILIGYSQGGPAAYLIAQKLENEDFRVGRLIMLEAPEPGSYDETEGDLYERMAVAAAIFTGRTEADMPDSAVQEEPVSVIGYFTDYLKDSFGEGADGSLLHSILETYMVYSSNALNPISIEGSIKAGIDSIILSEAADPSEEEAVEMEHDPWSVYTDVKGNAYAVYGNGHDHLAFLSGFKKQISRIVKKSLMK